MKKSTGLDINWENTLVKVHILSDLHNEFLKQNIGYPNHLWEGVIPETNADIIILAGDIDVGVDGVEWAIKESERLGKPILYVLGNHEFYYHEYYKLKEDVKKLADGTGVTVLDRGEFEYKGVRFIGATLWTDYGYPSVSHGYVMDVLDEVFMDHQVIDIVNNRKRRRFKAKDALISHIQEVNYLQTVLESKYDGKTVVITHHGPHMACQHPGFPINEISMAFNSHLSDMFERYQIDTWVFGHTHANIDLMIGSTRLVSNQAGYPGERVDSFDITKVLVL